MPTQIIDDAFHAGDVNLRLSTDPASLGHEPPPFRKKVSRRERRPDKAPQVPALFLSCSNFLASIGDCPTTEDLHNHIDERAQISRSRPLRHCPDICSAEDTPNHRDRRRARRPIRYHRHNLCNHRPQERKRARQINRKNHGLMAPSSRRSGWRDREKSSINCWKIRAGPAPGCD
jgi:hypothetical protein